jgi:hypothetical protein
MKKTILLFFSLCLMTITTAQAFTVTSTAGNLYTSIANAGGNPGTIASLTVTGTINETDLTMMSFYMPSLSDLNLKNATIVDNAIPDGAFAYTNLTSITLPSSLTTIGQEAFEGCNLTSIIIPSSVTSIGAEAFYICPDLTSVTFSSPSSVTSIGYAVFAGTGLTSITIPSSVTSIGANAFELCTALTSVTIPSSVTSIGQYAFLDCGSLTSIYSYATTPVDLTSSAQVFYAVNTTTCTLYVPTNSVSLYKAANQWQDFFNIVGTTITATQQIKDNVSISPNPVVNNFNISGLSAPQTLQLFDLNGKLILSQQVDNGTVPASFLKTGIYILKIGSFETKLIKQ